MSPSNEQIQALKAAAEKATKGEWWSDVIDEECITTYAVYGPDNRSLLDMLNSTAAEIHEEYDRDYFMQWDETAKRNADFIAKAHPDFILSLLAEREADKALIAELEQKHCGSALMQHEEHHVCVVNKLMERIAELESRTLTVSIKPPTIGRAYSALNHVWTVKEVREACAAAGITLKVGGE